MFHKLKTLFVNLAIYGLGDVITSIVSFFLLPIYSRVLTPEDYGVIGLLLTIEAVSKIIFRWGVDASFMRLYYDCHDDRSRQRLASTIFFFLLICNGAFLGLALLAAPVLAQHFFGSVRAVTVLRLTLINTFVVGFYFIPFHIIRILGQSRQFIALGFSRSVATIVVRILLIVGAGLGVLGAVLADIVVTVVFTAVLIRWFAPLIRWTFSKDVLTEALRFGLPRLPHGIAQQTIAAADRYWLSRFVSIGDIGLYSVGATFALALKLFLSAFEYAWQPFYFSTMREPDAKQTFSGITTYGLGVLLLLTAGLAALSYDVVRIMTPPRYYDAAIVIPWIALGVTFQGVYLLTSIGLNITKQTQYYPIATAISAGVSVGSNLLLIPRFGLLGAAGSNTLAYATLAGVSFVFSQRCYPMRYEWARIARLVGAALLGWAAGVWVLPRSTPALIGLLGRGVTVTAVYFGVLFGSGFFRPGEMARMKTILASLPLRRRTAPATMDTVELAGEIVGTTITDVGEEEPPHRSS